MLSAFRLRRALAPAVKSTLKRSRPVGPYYSTIPLLQTQAAPTGVAAQVADVPVSQELPANVRPSFGNPTVNQNNTGITTSSVPNPVLRSDNSTRETLFWQKIPQWKDVSREAFLSYRFSVANTVQGTPKLLKFLQAVLPDEVPGDEQGAEPQSRDDFIKDVVDGVTTATMAIRITPYVLSRINWENPRHDPIFRQFLPLKSKMLPDHPRLTLDSLHETADSPVNGLVHRYTDKALFLPTSVCPTYCMFCTRSYAVGADTETVTKASLKPTRKRWDAAFDYIERTPGLHDIVVSGGDSYYLQPESLAMIGERLIGIDHIKRFRFASKGLAVAPSRIIDESDGWFRALVHVSNQAKKVGKAVALHTHFNHPEEISWITEQAAQKLLLHGVTVRNQTVLLRGVNDSVEVMSDLIRKLADNQIMPYYVYQCDMVEKVEHLRTPLSTILRLEEQIRGSIAGFAMPQFVVDLPGGGGKRLACSKKSYDPQTGISTFTAPAVKGRDKENKVYEYYDPVGCLPGNSA